jgi:CBS domain-containing protein
VASLPLSLCDYSSLKEGRRFFQDPRIEPTAYFGNQNVENSLLRRVKGIAPRWTDEGAPGVDQLPLAICQYQVNGRLLNGGAAAICTLAEGSCSLQEVRPTTGGRHTIVCLQRSGVFPDSKPAATNLPFSAVRRYMTPDVVTVGTQVLLTELARKMIDAHIHRVIVIDEEHKPIGIVTSTNLLGALAYADIRA